MEKILLDKKLCDSLSRLARKNIIDKFHNNIIFNEILTQYSNLNNKNFDKL